MCGIFGYVGGRDDAARLVFHGLKKLEYRGYDSWGIATGGPTGAIVDRRVGKIRDAATDLASSRAALGHTRWATHGGISETNAHPQVGCDSRLALVHNGIVLGHETLRRELARAGHRIRSETDTELIVHLIEEMLPRATPGPEQLVRAVMAAFRELRGLNAIVVLDVATGCLVAAKNGSPLVVGFAPDGHFLASDHASLLDHTRRVTFVEDGQAVLADAQTVRLFEIEGGAERTPETVVVEWQPAAGDRGEHPDHMTNEMHQQPDLLRALASRSRAAARALAATLDAGGDVVAIGCGSGWHAALAAHYVFARAGRRIAAVAASEFGHLVQHVGAGTLVLAFSQSGETIDVLDAVRAARARGARIAAITNVEGSALWRLSDATVLLGAGPERCVLATKSFTAKLAVTCLAAAALGQQATPLDSAAASITRAAADIEGMLGGRRRDAIRALAQDLHTSDHLYVIGRGAHYPLALETALKIKEVSYVHAEGFASGELKHGVIALIEPGTPCIVLVPGDDSHPQVLASAMQLKARGARVIGMGPRDSEAFDHHIEVADAGTASIINGAVPGQLLGYEMARLRGCDPDRPRNLAKSVTVT